MQKLNLVTMTTGDTLTGGVQQGQGAPQNLRGGRGAQQGNEDDLQLLKKTEMCLEGDGITRTGC